MREEAKFKIGDQWFYRGNRSPTWFFLAERTDGSASGLTEKVPSEWWPLLEEVAPLTVELAEKTAALEWLMNNFGITLHFMMKLADNDYKDCPTLIKKLIEEKMG